MVANYLGRRLGGSRGGVVGRLQVGVEGGQVVGSGAEVIVGSWGGGEGGGCGCG